MKNRLIYALLSFLCLGWACKTEQPVKELPAIIPIPAQLEFSEGTFSFEKNLSIKFNEENKEIHKVADFLKSYIENSTSTQVILNEKNVAKNVTLTIDSKAHTNKEGYQLSVKENEVQISAPQAIGLLYGVQTLRQMMPVSMEKAHQGKVKIPFALVSDAPRYPYRGMHLDVGRHFFPVDFIKKYIDMISLFKMNTFHWHLTEDQGWRIEIKKYPKLTEIGSKRKETIIGNNNSNQGYDGQEYGGFYTQEEVKDIVQYATDRFITVIPEIELPGHSVAALAAYPELGCTGGPYEVRTKWGISREVYCAGNEKTFDFLEDVLSEVLELFPSQYIHIGGDECPKESWEKCPKCQKRIKEEGLNDEHELQSYFITRMEKFLNSKGRAIIGWDEILEGGLAPNATVMSWRGMKGGVEAAKQRHDVIMTPGTHCYFDHYQGDRKTEPLAIGGFTTVQRTYSFEPTPSELNEEEAKHILGAQGNVWTEYMKTSDHVEYMTFPRMVALSEVVWSPKEKRDWNGFQKRLIRTFQRLDLLGINYSRTIFQSQPKLTYDSTKNLVRVNIDYNMKGSEIRYTLDGSDPITSSTLYHTPFSIEKSSTLKVNTFREGHAVSQVLTKSISIDKATGKKIKLETKPSKRFARLGAEPLVNGLRGSYSFNDGKWLGFQEENLIAVIDMQEVTELTKLTIGTLCDQGAWIFPPKEIKLYTSKDGETYDLIQTHSGVDGSQKLTKKVIDQTVHFQATTRFIKVEVIRFGELPEWHHAAGKLSHLFIDRISLD